MTRSKAYLFGGVEIRWSCTKELLRGVDNVPEQATFHFADGLKDYLSETLAGTTLVHPDIFTGSAGKTGAHGGVQWAVAWSADADGFLNSYCNTIPTPDGGTHELGVRAALLRGLKDHAERVGQGKRAAAITSEDVMVGAARHALGLHPRAGIPGPDQGPPRHRRGATHRRAGDQGPVRPLARRQSAAGEQAVRLRRRTRRRAHPPPPGKGDRAQDRREESSASRENLPTAPTRPPKAPSSSSSRAIPPAAPRSRRATAPARRCCRCAERSQRRLRRARRSSRRTSSSPTSCRRSAAAPARTTATRICATAGW